MPTFRVFPSDGSALAYGVGRGLYLEHRKGADVTFYTDSSLTTLADVRVRNPDGSVGSAYPGSKVPVDASSQIPLFYGVDTDTLWVNAQPLAGQPALPYPVYARTDDRLDALETGQSTHTSGGSFAHAAAAVSFAPAGGLNSTNVQAGLLELETAILQQANNHTSSLQSHGASSVVVTPAGGITSTRVQAALEELDGDIAGHLADASAAHTATTVAFTPTGTIAATDVQAALAEVGGDAALALPYAPTEGVTLYAYGHSYAGSPVEADGTTAGTFPARTASRLDMVVKNRAIGGSKMIDAAFVVAQAPGSIYVAAQAHATPYPWGQRGVVVLDCELNDGAAVAPTALALTGFRNFLRTFLACVTTAGWIKHNDSGVTYSPGWAGDATTSNHGIAGTSGATVDFPGVTTDTAYYLGYGTDGSAVTGASMTALVGATELTTWSVNNAMATTYSDVAAYNFTVGPFVHKITGIGGTSGSPKTVRLRINNTGSAWVFGLLLPRATTPPLVLVAQDGLTNATHNFQTGAKAAYDTAIETVAAEFPTARVVDMEAEGWNPATMTTVVDGIHPNSRGAAFLAGAYADAIRDYLGGDFVAGVNYL